MEEGDLLGPIQLTLYSIFKEVLLCQMVLVTLLRADKIPALLSPLLTLAYFLGTPAWLSLFAWLFCAIWSFPIIKCLLTFDLLRGVIDIDQLSWWATERALRYVRADRCRRRFFIFCLESDNVTFSMSS